MSDILSPSHAFVIDLPDERATCELGRELSLFAVRGDLICLSGDLGAGKSTLARAFVTALNTTGSPIDVPSPTFTLVQHYDETRLPVVHYDFYRLNGLEEIEELGFFDGLEHVVSLVEWSDRLGENLPRDRLDVHLEIAGTGRRATIKGYGAMAVRLERASALSRFLERHDVDMASRKFLQGDASARRYERAVLDDGSPAIVMDMPAMPDGPVVKNGKSYSKIVHLAEDCLAVLAVNEELREVGLNAPRLFASDDALGFVLIEDFGDAVFGRMLLDGEDMTAPMTAATDVLVEIASRQWPQEVTVPHSDKVHLVRPFDTDAMLMEIRLLLDWYWPQVIGSPAPKEVYASYENIWQDLLPRASEIRPVWVLRDYHSPNLIWLPQRDGLKKVGLIDTQDCVLGPPAYDLASMLQDARVDIPRALVVTLFDYYCEERARRDAAFNRGNFELSYAIMGAQRACKILGIFHRLNLRDGKPGYLKNCPRVASALKANLAHPQLAQLKTWFDENLPLEPGSVP